MKVTGIFVSAGELPNCPQRKATYAINAHIKTAINNCSAHVSPDARRADARFGVPVCEIEIGSSCRVPCPPRAFLTEDQARKLLAVLEEPGRTIVLMLLLTGCRIGEVLALRWKHVDLDRGVLQ